MGDPHPTFLDTGDILRPCHYLLSEIVSRVISCDFFERPREILDKNDPVLHRLGGMKMGGQIETKFGFCQFPCLDLNGFKTSNLSIYDKFLNFQAFEFSRGTWG